MTSCYNVIMLEVIAGVYIVHRLNPLSVHFVYFSFFYNLLEVPVLMVPSLVHDGDESDDVYRCHGLSTS